MRTHRPGPTVRTEVRVGATVDEQHTAAEEFRRVGEHEDHPLREVVRVAEAAYRNGESVDGLGLLGGGELSLQQRRQHGTRGQRVEPDARPGPRAGCRLPPHPVRDSDLGSGVGHRRGRTTIESHRAKGLAGITAEQRPHGPPRNHRHRRRGIAGDHHHLGLTGCRQRRTPGLEQLDHPEVVHLKDLPRTIRSRRRTQPGGHDGAVEPASRQGQHFRGCRRPSFRRRQIGDHVAALDVDADHGVPRFAKQSGDLTTHPGGRAGHRIYAHVPPLPKNAAHPCRNARFAIVVFH